MCGIAGIISFNGHNQEEAKTRIKQMTDVIPHRGPDSEGFHVDSRVALGHRRLSIIDLQSGQQPMASEDERVWIVFNGEIYNYLDIRSNLKSEGYRFRTNSDTETIINAYLKWGSGCVEKLNGMFAFAIWDQREKKILIARDRVGKKPLYYCHQNGTFYFASELKALLAAGVDTGEICLEALDSYFSFGYIPVPQTIFKNIYKLRPAHALEIFRQSIKERRYWDLKFEPNRKLVLDEAVEQFDDLFNSAVDSRLMSEVPLGAFLSGGIDSSLVVSSMAENMNQPVLTNSIGFGDNRFNELPVARSVANYLKTDHREFVVTPKVEDILKKIAWHFDEPFADSSAIPTWYVCEMAKKNVTVALSGDGGDENFGGYTFRYIPHVVESCIRTLLPSSTARQLLFGVLGKNYPASAWMPRFLRIKTFLENLSGSDVLAFYNDLIWLRTDTRKELYSEDFHKELGDYNPFEVIKPIYESGNAHDPLSRALYTDINFYMTDNCLVKVDRMSMAHSLEVRSPFLDYRLMEFAATLPSRLKISRGKGKALLRRITEYRSIPEILKQPKRGFSIPAARWLRNELRPMAEQILLDRHSFSGRFLKLNRLKTVWKEHLNGARDHSVFLWGLLMLELWSNAHLKRQSILSGA